VIGDTRIKGLAFDAYGTLFDVFSVTSLCEELFPGSGGALATMWRAKQLQYSLLRTMMDRYKNFWDITEDSLRFSANCLRLNLSTEKCEKLLKAYLSLAAFPDVKPGLEALRMRGLRLAILSNGSPHMLTTAVDSAGIAGLLDAVISVDEVKVFKPSRCVYELAETHLHASANEIGFVSSNSWDVHGAGAAGLTTFWIQRDRAETSDELGYPAAHIVPTITALPSLLQRA
jgi:2-haloacid dehalogenase